MAATVYRFGNTPAAAYESTGVLHGFDAEALSGSDYDSPRARALYRAADVSPDDDDYQLGTLPDGRWALVGLDVEGHAFAIESAIAHAARRGGAKTSAAKTRTARANGKKGGRPRKAKPVTPTC